MNNVNWVECDSQNDMQLRLSSVDGLVFDISEQDYANTWGFIYINEKNIYIPIGFSHVGLSPEAEISNAIIYVGVTDQVLGYEISTGNIKFKYRVPSIFHEFIKFTGDGVVLQDETGFVHLSSSGDLLWMELCDDIVGSYQVDGNVISGKTDSDEEFKFFIGWIQFLSATRGKKAGIVRNW